MSTKRKKSVLWNHFTATECPSTGKRLAVCGHCNKSMAYSGATMSNLGRHMRRNHPQVNLDDTPMEVTVEEVEVVESGGSSQLKEFDMITLKGFEDLDSIIKPQEKEIHDPDWTPNEEDKSGDMSESRREKKATRRSVVWDHFEKSACKTSGQCLHCGKIIKLGTISNLARHLRLKHPSTPVLLQRPETHPKPTFEYNIEKEFLNHEEIDEDSEVVEVNVDDVTNPISIIETKTKEDRSMFLNSHLEYTEEMYDANLTQASQTEFLNEGEEFDINDFIKPKKLAVVAEQVDQQLVRMIVKGCHPVSIVSQPDFREFVSLLNPKYVLPTAQKLALELVPECYRECEKRTTKSLQSAEGIVLYVDQWTSKSHNYMCITAHIINMDCKFESLFLSCHILMKNENSVEISDRFNETVRDWEISEKIVAVVTDNSETLSSAVKICNWYHIPHFMKALTLVLHESLHKVKAIVIKVRNITEELTKQPGLLAEVYSARKSTMKLPLVKLMKKVSDNCNSSFIVLEMLTRFEKLKQPIAQVLKNHPEIQLRMTDIEWRNLSSYIEVLSVFKAVKREMFQEERVYMSKIVFYIKTLKSHMKKYQATSTEHSNDATYLATQILPSLESNFEDLENNHLLASVVLLDPRLKKYVFEDECDYSAACSTLRKEVCEVVLPEPNYPDPDPDSFWHTFDTEVRKMSAVKDPIGKGIQELEKYLQEPLLSRGDDPLTWWSERRAIYPRLFKLAKKYLCLTSKSSPRESISYKSAYMLSHLKYSESSPTESEVMFLHHNM